MWGPDGGTGHLDTCSSITGAAVLLLSAHSASKSNLCLPGFFEQVLEHAVFETEREILLVWPAKIPETR